MCQTIKRIYHFDLPTELLSLENLVIPEHMKKTLKNICYLN
ncbi:10823_t:CDS:2 [Scutellospora calospora]|uniref:10823_t:CDS:1 n=1 Tax=Scutellospora calospora TaxID=85575 RepID=A0ACA9K6M3_9GLOM|nr:10823_t:CDS:2 [Scutellospora calospora]